MGGREGRCWGLGGEVGISVWLSAAHPHPQLSPPGDPGCLGPGVLGAEGGVGSTGRAQGAHRWQRHKSVPRAGSKCQGTLSPRSGLWWLLARVISHFFKASWDSHPTGHQKPGRNLDLTAGPSPLVPCGRDKDQSPERQDLVEWGYSLFASVGLGIM